MKGISQATLRIDDHNSEQKKVVFIFFTSNPPLTLLFSAT